MSLEALRRAGENLGVSERLFRMWMGKAITLGLLRPVRSGVKLLYVGTAAAAAILGSPRCDPWWVGIPIQDLFSKGWRSKVWAMYINANHQGAQISRAKLLEITGIPISTQRFFDREEKTSRRPNLAITTLGVDHLDGLRDAGRPGPFAFYDPRVQEQRCAFHLPDTRRTTNRRISKGNPGRSRKINHAIRRIENVLSIVGQDTASHPLRLFFKTYKQAAKRKQAPETFILRHFHRTKALYGVWSVA